MGQVKAPFPKFKNLTLTDKEDLEIITRDFPYYSDFNFVSLFTWSINHSTQFSYLDNNLVIKLRDYVDKDKFIYTFIGNNNVAKNIKVLFDELKIKQLELIPEPIVNHIKDSNIYDFIHQRDQDDYLYKVDELVGLKGPCYRHFRRSLISFQTKNNFVPLFREIDLAKSDVSEKALELTKKWRNIKDKPFSEVFCEHYAIRRAIKYTTDLPIKAWGVFREEELLGFVIVEKLGTSVLLHYEKAATNISGLGTYLKHQTFLALSQLGCTDLNYEQDLGIPGLRQTKLSLVPSNYLKKYIVKIK